jgi:hypothetical protein
MEQQQATVNEFIEDLDNAAENFNGTVVKFPEFYVSLDKIKQQIQYLKENTPDGTKLDINLLYILGTLGSALLPEEFMLNTFMDQFLNKLVYEEENGINE